PVHLDDPRDAEALLEGRPDVRAETRAGGHPQAVVAVARRGRLHAEIAAELADVDEGDRLVAAHVVEEGVGRETTPRGERAADAEGGGEADEEALAVVEGQGRVNRLAGLDAEEWGEPEPRHHEAEVADDRRLRVAGRARGVDVEEHVPAAHGG